MQVIYRRHLEPQIDVTTPPQSERQGEVMVEWTVNGNRLTDLSFTVAGVTLDKDANGALITLNDGVMAKVFAAARFVSDRIRIQTGFDVIQPFSLLGNSPDDLVGETPQEKAYLDRHLKRGQRSITGTALITRPFDANVYMDFERLAVPLGHFARAQRADDPLEKFEDYFKTLEHFAARRPGDDPSGPVFDKQLSEAIKLADQSYDQANAKGTVCECRQLRRRVVHTRTTHADGHIGPADIEGIRQVQARLPEMEQFAMALLKNPPAFPR